MATAKQRLGDWGETLVARTIACPRCKTFHALRRLPPNFKCADIICDFCGYLAQVKTATSNDISKPPASVLGAAWEPQRRRMAAGIYFPLFLVLRAPRRAAIFYLAADFQSRGLFKRRKRLSADARRPGWRGFSYNLRSLPEGVLMKVWPVRLK
jgi:type II restriction enzyme